VTGSDAAIGVSSGVRRCRHRQRRTPDPHGPPITAPAHWNCPCAPEAQDYCVRNGNLRRLAKAATQCIVTGDPMAWIDAYAHSRAGSSMRAARTLPPARVRDVRLITMNHACEARAAMQHRCAAASFFDHRIAAGLSRRRNYDGT